MKKTTAERYEEMLKDEPMWVKSLTWLFAIAAPIICSIEVVNF